MHIAILVGVITMGALMVRSFHSEVALAQGERFITPEGFEFATTTPLLKYNYPTKGSKAITFEGKWVAEVAEGVQQNYVIDSAEVKPGAEPVVSFSLKKNEGAWPSGLYRLEVRADGKLVHTERFMIR
jgi:hypothetical protein